ncbi:MAG: EF-P beta-lysylation protein EpmB [Cellvibrionaceae bacterium]|nr:EF-P beta-lysylation protein EpmB [Cellvibrionaceae bacterium]|tara:strand:+ start:9350 stop:10354 length:1005 start_codon:yes stop_codon:yes gene_type:complete
MSTSIPATPLNSWQEELIQAIDNPRELLEVLHLPMTLLPAAEAASNLFGLKVPRPFVERMRKGDPNDPLLRQVLPLGDELKESEGYQVDPLQEQNTTADPGLVHKYKSRVLLIAAPNCAINCRYCFRRHFPYQDNNPARAEWLQTFATIAADDNINEVILSGGDPLANSDRQLQWMVDQLAQIAHVKRLRIHTRLPIVIPQRITDATLRWLTSSRLQTIVVLHSNHPAELDDDVANSVKRLRAAHITVLNQAVLLKSVNDDLTTQVSLSERLFDIGALPYYLHLPDKVQATAHFDIQQSEAIALHQQMQSQLSGFLVPKLVKEEPGQSQKTLIF